MMGVNAYATGVIYLSSPLVRVEAPTAANSITYAQMAATTTYEATIASDPLLKKIMIKVCTAIAYIGSVVDIEQNAIEDEKSNQSSLGNASLS